MLLTVGIFAMGCNRGIPDWLDFEVEFDLGEHYGSINRRRANRIMDNWLDKVGSTIEDVATFSPFIARQTTTGTRGINDGSEDIEESGITKSDGVNLSSKTVFNSRALDVFSMQSTDRYYLYNGVLQQMIEYESWHYNWDYNIGNSFVNGPEVICENNPTHLFIFKQRLFSKISPFSGFEILGFTDLLKVNHRRSFVWGAEFTNGYAFMFNITERFEMQEVEDVYQTGLGFASLVFIFDKGGYLVEHALESDGRTYLTMNGEVSIFTTQFRTQTRIEYTIPTIEWPNFVS